MPNELTDDLNDELEDGGDDESSDESPAPEGEPKGEPKLDAKTQKRIDDLIAARDKEIARANKAEQALKASDKGTAEGSPDPAQQALLQELREASLDAVYGEYPELKKFGIDRSLIEGSTRAQMRESATSIVALVKGVATAVRNEVLAEHGINAEASGATRQPPKDFAAMSDEEFRKLLDTI